MTTFTAFAGIDTTYLQEVYAITRGSEQPHTDTSAQFDLTPGGGRDQGQSVVLTLTGSGFGTANVTPDSGWLISTMTATVNGQTVWTMTGLDVISLFGGAPQQLNGAELVSALESNSSSDSNGNPNSGGNNPSALLFGGDDTIHGSAHGNDALFGFDGDDLIVAGAGNVRLGENGGGHATLIGGSGHDAFVFTHWLDGFSDPTIKNFNVHRDVIELSSTASNIAHFGVLTNAEFHVGAHATTAAHRIIYNPKTGVLYYDHNGSHAGGQVEIADMHAHLPLTASDFMII